MRGAGVSIWRSVLSESSPETLTSTLWTTPPPRPHLTAQVQTMSTFHLRKLNCTKTQETGTCIECLSNNFSENNEISARSSFFNCLFINWAFTPSSLYLTSELARTWVDEVQGLVGSLSPVPGRSSPPVRDRRSSPGDLPAGQSTG